MSEVHWVKTILVSSSSDFVCHFYPHFLCVQRKQWSWDSIIDALRKCYLLAGSSDFYCHIYYMLLVDSRREIDLGRRGWAVRDTFSVFMSRTKKGGWEVKGAWMEDYSASCSSKLSCHFLAINTHQSDRWRSAPTIIGNPILLLPLLLLLLLRPLIDYSKAPVPSEKIHRERQEASQVEDCILQASWMNQNGQMHFKGSGWFIKENSETLNLYSNGIYSRSHTFEIIQNDK